MGIDVSTTLDMTTGGKVWDSLIKQFYFANCNIKEFLHTTLEHEKEHCIKFQSYMPIRSARPCRMMFLWGCGGYLLGLITALFGKNAVLVCTKAVESTVHMHLNDQIHFLTNKDEDLKRLIEDIKIC